MKTFTQNEPLTDAEFPMRVTPALLMGIFAAFSSVSVGCKWAYTAVQFPTTYQPGVEHVRKSHPFIPLHHTAGRDLDLHLRVPRHHQKQREPAADAVRGQEAVAEIGGGGRSRNPR